MNKRATVQATLFSVLTLALAVSIIFLFVSNYSKASTKLKSPVIYDELYSKESKLEFYLYQIAQISLAESYNKIAISKDFLDIPKIDSFGYYEFRGLSNKTNNRMLEEFNKEFVKNINKIDLNDESSLGKLKTAVNNKDYDVLMNGSEISLSIKNILLEGSDKDVSAVYKPDISVSTNFNEIGLDSFERLYDFKERCSAVEDIYKKKECYLKNKYLLKNFYIDADILSEGNKNKILIRLNSKKRFLIDGDLRKISFEFSIRN